MRSTPHKYHKNVIFNSTERGSKKITHYKGYLDQVFETPERQAALSALRWYWQAMLENLMHSATLEK